MPIALQRIPAYIISSRDMGVHAGFMLHGLGKNSGPRTLIPAVEMLLRNSCAMRSHRPPRSSERRCETTNHCRYRLQHCASRAYQHCQVKRAHARGSL